MTKAQAILAALAGLVVVGFIAKPPAPAQHETAADMAQRLASEGDRKEREATARRVEALGGQIEIFCEKATRAKLAVPDSAKFDQSSVRHDPDPKRASWKVYETFSYKNPMNATLPGALLCTVDTSDNMIRLVELKVGRP